MERQCDAIGGRWMQSDAIGGRWMQSDAVGNRWMQSDAVEGHERLLEGIVRLFEAA